MSDLVCVTNRRLCGEDFLTRVARIADCHPAALILREKDLSEADYETLAREVGAICEARGVPWIPHTYTDVAARLGADTVHLPLSDFRAMTVEQKQRFRAIGVSCHSPEEAREAERLGAAYVTAGHIFETDCKEGLPGRGLSFLRDVRSAVRLPVLAIGGIDAHNAGAVRAAGASGLCVMSGCMQCTDVAAYLNELDNAVR